MCDLKELLTTWKLDNILPHLMEEEIDIDTLAIMKVGHIKSLLRDFPLGLQIRFEHYFEKWRQRIGKPLKHMAKNEVHELTIKQTMDNITPKSTLNITPKHTDFLTPINLKEILLQSIPEGPELLQIYDEHETFSNPERSQLIDLIVGYYLKNDLPFDLHISYDLENAILSLFPNERLEMYRKRLKGKIYTKYLTEKGIKQNTGELEDDRNHVVNIEENSMNKNEQRNNNSRAISSTEMVENQNMLMIRDCTNDDRNDNNKLPEEILLQTIYNGCKRFVKILEPFAFQDFFAAACSTFNINHSQNFYIAVNECEISHDDFKNVVLQYYKLPTFNVELKERVAETKLEPVENSCVPSEYYTQSNTYTPIRSISEHNNSAVQIIVNHLPDANDIRNIPSLLPIVKMSDDGRALENKHRTAIAKAIIDECLNFQPERVLKRQDFFKLTDNLIQAFPNETASAYFIPSQPNHAARGKLWNAYNNKRSFLGSSGIVQRRQHSNAKRKLHSDEDEFSERTNDKIYVSDNLIECKEFSLHSILDWETLKEKWTDCHQERRKELLRDKMTPQFYMQKYSILKSNRGVDLMEIDVNILHPTVVHVNNWLSLHEKVIEMGRKQHKAEQRLKIFESIDSSNNEKYRANLALLILPYIFPYNARRNEFNEKASKFDIQKRFIKEYASLDELNSDVECAELQIRFVHCNDQISYVEYKICENMFKCMDLLEALNSLFHYTVALNLEYPKICLHIWQFIQLAIFQIEIQGMKQPNVESTLNDLYML